MHGARESDGRQQRHVGIARAIGAGPLEIEVVGEPIWTHENRLSGMKNLPIQFSELPGV